MSMRVKSTIQDVISAGKELKLCNRELSLKSVLTNSNDEKFIINITNVFEQYYEILLENTVVVTLTDEEYLKYRFKPKVLSFDLYGTIELHYLLLRLNHVYSVINFDFTELRVFNTNILDLLNEILVLENDNLIGNEVDIIKEINE